MKISSSTIPVQPANSRMPKNRRAFSLLEVMIAVGIFFMALISILGVMTRGLATARSLQRSGPDCGILAASISLTNQLHDGKSDHGDFGKMYPGFSWERETYCIGSNGLFQLNFFIFKQQPDGRTELYDAMSTWMYKPDSPKTAVSLPVFGGADGGGLRGDIF